MVTVFLVAACAGKNSNDSVWNTYDVRYPVPATSNVPVSRATQYPRYYDNDDFYTPPDGRAIGLCTESNLGSANCD